MTNESIAAIDFLGSPSIRVNGVDVECKRTSQGALCFRTWEVLP